MSKKAKAEQARAPQAAPVKDAAEAEAPQQAKARKGGPPFPGGSRAPEPGELRVAVDKVPYAEVIGHAIVEPDVEVCGVLVGRVGEDEHGPFVHVTAAIAGKEARQEGTAVTFTHETWNHIHQELDRRFPEAEIVGWYHTHGGFGVFLSEMDTFVHDNFFSGPHHLAYVYDPLAGSEAFFHRGEGGKLEPVRRYWLAGRERRPATRQPDAEPPKPKAAPVAAGGDGAGAAALERAALALARVAEDGGGRGALGALLPWVVAVGAVLLLVMGGGRGIGLGGGAERPAGPVVVVAADPGTGSMVGVPLEVLDPQGGGVARDAQGTLRPVLVLPQNGLTLLQDLSTALKPSEQATAEREKRAQEEAQERKAVLRLLMFAGLGLAGAAALGGAAWWLVLRNR
ncbi:MAG: hypothetical protein QM767_01600 [Anaeromyxobacter sp.]